MGLGSRDTVDFHSLGFRRQILLYPFSLLTRGIAEDLVIPLPRNNDKVAPDHGQAQGVGVARLLQRVSMVTCTFVAHNLRG